MVAEYSSVDSVKPAKSLEEMGLGFVGVVKQASRKFTISHMKILEFNCRVYYYGLVY